MRSWPLVLLMLVAGCLGPLRPPVIFDGPEAALAAVEADVEAGKWQSALDKLQAAELQFPDDPTIFARRAALSVRWDEVRTEWLDRLVLVRAQAQRDEIFLLQRLHKAQHVNLVEQWQLEREQAALQARRADLIACAERQLERDLELAQRCADLADALGSDSDSQQLRETLATRLGDMEAELEAQKDARQEAEQAKIAAAKARQRRVAKARRGRKLADAEALAEQGQEVRAMTLLEQVLQAEPENERAKALQAQLQANLAAQARVLSELADRLYAENNLQGAIPIWEASLRLVPEQPDVLERYERAQRVRENLEQLRAQPSFAEEPEPKAKAAP